MTHEFTTPRASEHTAQPLYHAVLALLQQKPGAEAELRSLVQSARCDGGPTPDVLCDLALHMVTTHGPVSGLSEWAFEVLGKQLGIGFFFALSIAASHQRDVAGCQRCVRLLCERARWRWRPFQTYRQLAKQRGLCLRTLHPVLPRLAEASPSAAIATVAATDCSAVQRPTPGSPRDWRTRRLLWSRLACQGSVDELLTQAEREMKRSGQPLNAMDLAFLLRAARRTGTSAQLVRTLRLVPSSQQAADSVLLQEVLCALRRLRQPSAAWQLVDEATRAGQRLNCLHYTTLLAMCGDHADHLGVLRILSDMQELGIPQDALFTATLARLQASR